MGRNRTDGQMDEHKLFTIKPDSAPLNFVIVKDMCR